jgi:hypothetical protein
MEGMGNIEPISGLTIIQVHGFYRMNNIISEMSRNTHVHVRALRAAATQKHATHQVRLMTDGECPRSQPEAKLIIEGSSHEGIGKQGSN